MLEIKSIRLVEICSTSTSEAQKCVWWKFIGINAAFCHLKQELGVDNTSASNLAWSIKFELHMTCSCDQLGTKFPQLVWCFPWLQRKGLKLLSFLSHFSLSLSLSLSVCVCVCVGGTPASNLAFLYHCSFPFWNWNQSPTKILFGNFGAHDKKYLVR